MTDAPVRPGEILRQQFLAAHELALEDLATLLETSLGYVQEVIDGHRRIMPELAEKLADLFGTTCEYWLALQFQFDEDAIRGGARTRRVITAGPRRSSTHEHKDVNLRKAALALVDAGFTSEQAGQRIGVPKMTVAGWRSARTKGQYEGE